MAEKAQNVMLAEKWTEDIDPVGYFISEKLDGVRAYWSGETFFTRNGNVLNAPKWFKQGFPNVPLDGELWCGHNQFRKTVSIVRRKEPSDDWKFVKYYVFDAPEAKGGFEKRLQFIQQSLKPDTTPFALTVGMKICVSKEQMLQELKLVEKANGEGLMLRQPGSAYHYGRSRVLLKVKNFFDEEAIVVGHEKGSGRLANSMGHLVVKTPDGRQFSVGSGFTDQERSRPPKIGAIITYRYQELTSKSNKPRFPVYIGTRIDLNWDDYCKNYKPPTLNTPGDLKLNNSILYSMNHGLGHYSSDHLGGPSSSSGSGSSSTSSSSGGDPSASSSTSSSTPSSAAPTFEAPQKRKRAEEDKSESESDKPPCKYGANCYQKSAEHLQRFSHPAKSPIKKPKPAAEEESTPAPAPAAASSTPTPTPAPAPTPTPTPTPVAAVAASGDSSTDSSRRRTLHYSTDPSAPKPAGPQYQPEMVEDEEEKLICIYGDKCYRKNKLHYSEFYHPATHPLIAKGQMPDALVEGQPKPQKAPVTEQADEGKGKEKAGEETEAAQPELTETLVVPDQLNTSLAALTSSSEDDSITWDANEGNHTATDSEVEKVKFGDDDNDVATFVIPKKPSNLQENDQTFVLPPKKKSTDSDQNQTVIMGSLTQKMPSETAACVCLIPSALGKEANLKGEVLAKYKLSPGLNILGRNFGNLEIHDSRVSRHQLEAFISSSSPPAVSLTLRGLNASGLRNSDAENFAPMPINVPLVVKDGTEIAFLPDNSHRFVIRII